MVHAFKWWAMLLLLLLFPSVQAALTPPEQQFLNVPRAESARENLRFITSKPHVAGTDGDFLMADYVATQFKKAGIPDVGIFELEVLLNYPKSPPSVTLLQNGDIVYTPSLSEDILEQDDTSDTFWRNHTFHGYSPSGNVVGPVIYANYGRPQDFEALKNSGISVNGAIVMVRYGQCFRGLKVKNAQLRGAAGVIIYSDPQEDGYSVGPVYPAGPWRPAHGVQRGSVQFNSKCAGDPMRADGRYNVSVADICGVDSYHDLIPQIPSVPMSYGDAQPILEKLGGKACQDVGGDEFCGGLPLNYTVGPSTGSGVTLRLVVDNRDKITPIPNVIGKIPGTLPPDRDMPVLLGNHRDAWVYGAADPNSGTASIIEVARGLGELIQTGWKAKRTIYLLSWSGEEYGLLGSTGWGELNQNALERAVAYLNVDIAVSGSYLKVSATPSLTTLWREVMHELNTTRHMMDFQNRPAGEVRDANTDMLLDSPEEIGILGSGSDFTVFLDHLGIASMDITFAKPQSQYGQYHSIYDSFSWIDKYGGLEGQAGSSFELMAFVAKIWGLLALRLADNDALPIDVVVQGVALSRYVGVIQERGAGLDLTDLEESVGAFRKAAAAVAVSCQSSQMFTVCNEKLGLVERRFLSEKGLPRRQWFKHVLQAPGIDLGYAAEAFPGVQQAMDDGNLVEAQEQVGVVSELVLDAAVFLQDGLLGANH